MRKILFFILTLCTLMLLHCSNQVIETTSESSSWEELRTLASYTEKEFAAQEFSWMEVESEEERPHSSEIEIGHSSTPLISFSQRGFRSVGHCPVQRSFRMSSQNSTHGKDFSQKSSIQQAKQSEQSPIQALVIPMPVDYYIYALRQLII